MNISATHPSSMANMASDKPVNTVVLDAGGIIKNEPTVSTLLSQAETLVTVPAIISEIKDAATRSRVETTLKPFLTLRSPNPTSIKFVTEFARKTGDLAVLSKPDIQIIALTYEIECERNGGDWRLRRVPGQKGVNGAPPAKVEAKADEIPGSTLEAAPEADAEPTKPSADGEDAVAEQETNSKAHQEKSAEDAPTSVEDNQKTFPDAGIAQITSNLEATALNAEQTHSEDVSEIKVDSAQDSAADQADSDSDSDGWITASNLKKKQAADAAASTSQTPEPRTMQAAVLTSDFAMQNVILQMNLNLLSPSMTRIKQLRTYVLRCHACFCVHKDLSKQFCSRCGQPALTRVSCSTSANGEFKLHLKKNMQWNTRGDRYSIPKPVHGSTNTRRIHGGGKGGWGNELILAEDQKEFARASAVEKRQKERSLMDEDYLPSILSGDRSRAGGRMKVGAGRNVNSRKR